MGRTRLLIFVRVACRRQYYLEREMTYGSLERYRKQAAQRAAMRAEQMRREHASSASSSASTEPSNS